MFIGCLMAITSSAQDRARVPNLPKFDLDPKHFGFYLGINQMNFVIKPADGLRNIVWQKNMIPDLTSDSARILGVESVPVPGFSIGIVANLRLNNWFDLRFLPGLLFGERQLLYSVQQYDNNKVSVTEIPKNITSTFIDFPLYIKAKTKRVHNFRAFVTAGVAYKIDLASAANDQEVNPNDISVKLTKNDLTYDMGVGFDIYTVYFKFSTELKMSYGMNDMIFREQNIYSGAFGKLSTKIFQVNFTFE